MTGHPPVRLKIWKVADEKQGIYFAWPRPYHKARFSFDSMQISMVIAI